MVYAILLCRSIQPARAFFIDRSDKLIDALYHFLRRVFRDVCVVSIVRVVGMKPAGHSISLRVAGQHLMRNTPVRPKKNESSIEWLHVYRYLIRVVNVLSRAVDMQPQLTTVTWTPLRVCVDDTRELPAVF